MSKVSRRSIRPILRLFHIEAVFGSSLALVAVLCGCSKPVPPASPPPSSKMLARLDSYFENYCDYTGGLGIGFVPTHSYDYRFRQQLKNTQDIELKRLYVLKHLHREVEVSLDDFKAGIIRTGKSSARPLTLSEWQSAQQSLFTRIGDLANFTAFTNFANISRNDPVLLEPGLEAGWLNDLLANVRSVTNAPALNP